MTAYPFPSINMKNFSKLRKGQDYDVWLKPGVDIKALLEQIEKPIIEIGGPTDDGYYFLENVNLPHEVRITNIHEQPPTSDDQEALHRSMVDEVVDGRNLPNASDSVGTFLMMGMTITSDWYLELPEDERDQKEQEIEAEFDIARLEMEQVAAGALNPTLVKFAQRVPIYLEVKRCLAKGGLFLTDGTITEIGILKQLGFELLAFTQELIRPEQNGDLIYYEIVVRK